MYTCLLPHASLRRIEPSNGIFLSAHLSLSFKRRTISSIVFCHSSFSSFAPLMISLMTITLRIQNYLFLSSYTLNTFSAAATFIFFCMEIRSAMTCHNLTYPEENKLFYINIQIKKVI